MVEVWKAVGMDMERVQFLNCSEEINSRCAGLGSSSGFSAAEAGFL
jgi:hypothetical protein